jgi:tRNA(fMet)-specific endonuclease VapC
VALTPTARRVALDTSFYSRLRKGQAAALDTLVAAGTILVPVVVVGELEAGFRLGSRYAENRRMLDEFLAEPFVVVQEITDPVARRYGQIFERLRRAGTPIPSNDIWIAACAIEADAELLTADSDFERVPDLRLRAISSRAGVGA